MMPAVRFWAARAATMWCCSVAIMARCRRCLMARRRAALPFRRSAMAATIWSARFAALEKMRLVMVHSLLLASWSSLTPSSLWRGRVLLPGLVPRRNDWGWFPGPSKPRPVRGFVVLTRWSCASLLPWLGLGPVAGWYSILCWLFTPPDPEVCRLRLRPGLSPFVWHYPRPSPRLAAFHAAPWLLSVLGYSIPTLSDLNRLLLFWNELIIAK
ncbi:hypothetical protein D3C73_490390 [compost metagenome]